MVQIQNFTLLKEMPQNRFEKGEVAWLTDEEKLVYYNGEKWVEMQGSAEGLSLNLYELNKTIINQLEPLSEQELAEREQLINEFDATILSDYYMLLCKDISYYTIFDREKTIFLANPLGEEVIDCVKNVGEIMSIDKTEDGNIEIWVRNNEDVMCMYLFDCKSLVVKFGR